MSTNGKRSEKLSLARKKLKQYQKSRDNNLPTSNSVHGFEYQSRESLSSFYSDIRRSEIDITFQSDRHSVRSLPNNSGFFHDERRSAFERVRSSSSQMADIDTNEDPGTMMIAGTTAAHDNVRFFSHIDVDPFSIVDSQTINDDSSATPTNGTDDNETKTMVLKLAEMKDNYDKVVEQLQQLHGHYSQLHGAYAILNESVQNKSNSVQDIDLNKQLQQHIQTISVLVGEKTELQSQLRKAMEIANSKHVENEELQGRLKANRERLDELELETDTAKSGRSSLEATLGRQKDELDRRRQQTSQCEATIVEIAQDRSELQARLKVKARELDRLQAELGDTKKQLHMNAIYIRQLNAHAEGVVQQQQQEDVINTAQAENEQLECAMRQAQLLAEQWKKEADQAKQQYELYGRELNRKVVQLSAQLEQSMEESLNAEARAKSLQEQLNSLVENPPVIEDQTKKDVEPIAEMDNSDDLFETRRQLSEFSTQFTQLESANHRLHDLVQNKDSELTTIRIELHDNREKMADLEEKLRIQTQCSSNSRSLLDDLQNEKATVSRAIAQNRDLKQQFTELQDRFVVLTEENMDRETRMQASLYALEALQKKLDIKETACDNAELEYRLLHEQLSKSPQINCMETEVPGDKTKMDELARQVSRLDSQLNETCKAHRLVANENSELHRIMQQNAEDENQNTIHVELQQALDRIAALTAENDSLRALESNSLVEIHNPNSRFDDGSSICSEHGDGKGDDDSRELVNSMHQLKDRFIKAMSENADLNDRNQQLEHLIQQLQCETDTIGEYVTLYQHQRKVIRERLKERERFVARLARDKQMMQGKLNELHDLVMSALHDRGILLEYPHPVPIRGDRKTGKNSSFGETVRNKTRSFSQTTVNEFSGDEEMVVDGTKDCIPTRIDNVQDDADDPESGQDNGVISEQQVRNGQSQVSGLSVHCQSSDLSSTTERIFRLLSELQSHPSATSSPVVGRNMHCRECKGKLIVI